MSTPTPVPAPPSWWQTQLAGIEKWGIAHWTYIATFAAGQALMFFFHI